MTTDVLLGGAMLAAAVLYVLTGGADYGGGVWDLFARGPRRAEQRALVEEAIAPVWEANHVWLIALIVILFSGFPLAFALVSTALHIPLTLVLLGIVARGAAFTFRAYDSRDDRVQRRWGLVFSVASVITPVMLGVVVGSLSTGGIEVTDRQVTSGFFQPWATGVFPWMVGLLTLSLFAYVAAVYLTVEAEEQDRELTEDFRRRALVSAGVATAAAAVTFLLSADGAPLLWRGLTEASWSLALFAVTAGLAAGAAWLLWKRRYRLARLAAAGQVAFVVLGWGAAQHPYLLADAVTLAEASAPSNVQLAIFVVLCVGGIPLGLALRLLFRIFKQRSRP